MIDVATATWTEVAAAAPGAIALIPVGAIEAHGPHLPLTTDVIIACEIARRAAARLEARGQRVLILPPVAYTPAPFARAFAGTVAADPEGVRRTLESAAAAARSWGVGCVALVNAHLDPAHVEALGRAAQSCGAVFANILDRQHARKLPAEFRQGGPHAGRFETSLVLAARPDLVREEVRRNLAPVEVNLGRAILQGARTFHEAGGPQAYFGDPAAATAGEGEATYEVLAGVVVEEVLGRINRTGGAAGEPPLAGR